MKIEQVKTSGFGEDTYEACWRKNLRTIKRAVRAVASSRGWDVRTITETFGRNGHRLMRSRNSGWILLLLC